MASNGDANGTFAQFTGLGFGGTHYHHDVGGAASADAAMQQNTHQQQHGAAGGYRDASGTSFVAAHVVDPEYRFYENTAYHVPPPPPPPPINLPPPIAPPIAPQNWTIQGAPAPPLHPPPLGLPVPPPPQLDFYGVPHHVVPSDRPFSSSFLAYGNMALQRRGMEDGLPLPLPLPNPAPANTFGESDLVSAQVQLARDRAMKIIQKIHDNDISKAESEVSRKRKASLEQLSQRKRVAMVKNLEYLAKVEDDRLKSKLLKMHETRDYQNQLESYHQQSLQKRLQNLGKGRGWKNTTSTNATSTMTNQAGIGTQQRQWTEDKRRKNHQLASSDTVALYVSNLPTDGSASEDLLQALFGGLGYPLRKIHVYVNKQTGELKGDALVVYASPSNQDRNTLTETVCSQVRSPRETRRCRMGRAACTRCVRSLQIQALL
jgi:hypothetical protein